MHSRHIRVQLPSTLQLAQDGHDATGPMDVFNMVLVRIGRNLAQLGYRARQAINVSHTERNFRLLSNR